MWHGVGQGTENQKKWRRIICHIANLSLPLGTRRGQLRANKLQVFSNYLGTPNLLWLQLSPMAVLRGGMGVQNANRYLFNCRFSWIRSVLFLNTGWCSEISSYFYAFWIRDFLFTVGIDIYCYVLKRGIFKYCSWGWGERERLYKAGWYKEGSMV